MSAQKFFNKAIGNNGKPRIVNIDKSGSNNSAILTVNKRSLSTKKIKIRKVKYLNNIIEQDHSDKYEDKIKHYQKENTYVQTLTKIYYEKNPNFLKSELISKLNFKVLSH